MGLNEMPSREGGKEGELSRHDSGRDDHGQLACMRTRRGVGRASDPEQVQARLLRRKVGSSADGAHLRREAVRGHQTQSRCPPEKGGRQRPSDAIKVPTSIDGIVHEMCRSAPPFTGVSCVMQLDDSTF